MKHLFAFAIAAATLSAAIPAEAAIPGQPAGTSGRGGHPAATCFTSTVGKHPTTCPKTVPPPAPFFWLP